MALKIIPSEGSPIGGCGDTEILWTFPPVGPIIADDARDGLWLFRSFLESPDLIKDLLGTLDAGDTFEGTVVPLLELSGVRTAETALAGTLISVYELSGVIDEDEEMEGTPRGDPT